MDVIVVGRGGGSDDDLMAFNTELLAEVIHAAGTPVVSAVGHRADATIADRVADASAITPTAAGVTVVENREDLEAEVDELEATLEEAYTTLASERIDALEDDLEAAYAAVEREQARIEAATAARTIGPEAWGLSYRLVVGALLALVLVLLGVLVWVVVLCPATRQSPSASSASRRLSTNWSEERCLSSRARHSTRRVRRNSRRSGRHSTSARNR